MADLANSTTEPDVSSVSNRRGFLRGLATLPLIGGSVALMGQPSAAAVPVTDDLMHSYKSWLYMEHKMLSYEIAGHDYEKSLHVEDMFYLGMPGDKWHFQWSGRGPAGWIDAPQPSTRAAVILSAAGVPLV
jgi:hypothetical protein